MPFIRLSDNYINHPKFLALSDGAFRLWHEGMAYARMHQTDGLITFKALKTFQAFTKSREKQLSTPHQDGAHALWELIPATGYKVHDYLDWNPSREEENERRAESKERMRVMRDRRHRPGTPPPKAPVTSFVTASPQRVTAHDVPVQEKDRDRDYSEKRTAENSDEDAIYERAGRLREELYPAWYAQWRHGARMRLVASPVEFQDAISLVRTWDDERLAKLARIVLTTNDEWISGTDRGFKIFATKATWADDKLREWEKTNGVAV